MRVFIITKGGLEIGMGHVSRSVALAQHLESKAETTFIVNNDKMVLSYLDKAKFPARSMDYDKIIPELRKEHIDTIVIDHLHVNEDFARSVKTELNTKLVIIGNSTPANKFADIVANTRYEGTVTNRKLKEGSTTYYIGPKYILLRKEFDKFQSIKKNSPDRIRNILLTFGGSDPSNLTCAALRHLISIRPQYKIDVILGVHFEYFNELNRLLQQYSDINLEIYRDIDNIAEQMYKADLVITSPGVSFFESLYVGTYTIAVNQNLLQKKWIEGSFPYLDKNEIGKIGEFIKAFDFIDPASEEIRHMEIGSGQNELVEAILKI